MSRSSFLRGLRLVSLCLVVQSVGYSREADTDADGLSDRLEQALLVRFAPQLHVSGSDCDVAPAEFFPGSLEPRVKARNGTVYGQVFPATHDGAGGRVEIHFYHLWAQDCGLTHHPLDAESVSGLLRAVGDPHTPEAWHAEYWYAAAHEGTLCDMGNAATAAALGAVDRGPDVRVSRNKHASYLARELCSRGCGGDLCDGQEAMRISGLVNLGEPGAPMNGSDWTGSTSWPLASKMTPRFTDALLARMPRGNEVAMVPARDLARGTHGTIRVAARTYRSLLSANSSRDAGLSSAERNTTAGFDAAGSSARHAGRALGAAGAAVTRGFRWIDLRLNTKP